MRMIYVAGPYRPHTLRLEQFALEENIMKASKAAYLLWEKGWAVICPHMNTAYYEGLPDQVWLDGDIEILSRCDAIYMLDTWKNSQGARNELKHAIACCMETYFQEQDGIPSPRSIPCVREKEAWKMLEEAG